MSIKYKAFAVIIGLITAPFGMTSLANAAADPVIESCNNRASQAGTNSVCFHYVDAFIAGAETYDDILVGHFRRDHQERSDFLKRAYQTRLGMSHSKEYPHAGVPFCITNGIGNQDLVGQVLTSLPTALADRKQLHTSILANLVEAFPCR